MVIPKVSREKKTTDTVKYLRKRIYLNGARSKYCVVKLYLTKKLMREAYAKHSGSIDEISGAHCVSYKIGISKDGLETLSAETGTVFLYYPSLGAGIVSHELLHAAMWAWKHIKGKEQYPITINSMEDEEELLYNHTAAVRQFYAWYWKIEPKLKQLSK